MKAQTSAKHDDFGGPLAGVGEVEETSEDDLWFLPGPIDVAFGSRFQLKRLAET